MQCYVRIDVHLQHISWNSFERITLSFNLLLTQSSAIVKTNVPTAAEKAPLIKCK